MRRPLLGRAANALNAIGLGDTAFRIFERMQALTGPRGEDPGLPPPYLRVLTAGFADPRLFVQQGQAAAAEFLALAAEHGPAPAAGGAVLEFGCGAGRVARWLAPRVEAAFHGCDINERLVAWCRNHLPGRFELSRLEPPLAYTSETFDLVYALSVFTHMHEPVARAWLKELARITKPGGLALLTYLDDRLPQATDVAETLRSDGFAVRREGAEGSNLLCGYFTDKGFAARGAPEWLWVDRVPSDVSATGQAVAVLRRA